MLLWNIKENNEAQNTAVSESRIIRVISKWRNCRNRIFTLKYHNFVNSILKNLGTGVSTFINDEVCNWSFWISWKQLKSETQKRD